MGKKQIRLQIINKTCNTHQTYLRDIYRKSQKIKFLFQNVIKITNGIYPYERELKYTLNNVETNIPTVSF